MTERLDPYAALASIYDEWHERLSVEWVLRLENQLARFELIREGLSFLDLGCGTGTLLVALRTRHPGWRLSGLDISPAMLGQARRKQQAETIAWVEGPFEEARHLGSFDVVGCFFDAFNHLTEDGALEGAIRGAAAALSPDGLLIFDLNNRRGCQERSLAGTRFDRRDWGISVSNAFDGSSGIETTDLVIRRDQNPPVEAVIRRRCFSPEEVARALEAAGLVGEVEESWSYARGEIAGKTWYVARRPPDG